MYQPLRLVVCARRVRLSRDGLYEVASELVSLNRLELAEQLDHASFQLTDIHRQLLDAFPQLPAPTTGDEGPYGLQERLPF